MSQLSRRELLALLLAAPAAVHALGDESGEWISLFDGKSLYRLLWFRLYGPEPPLFTKSRALHDVERVAQ